MIFQTTRARRAALAAAAGAILAGCTPDAPPRPERIARGDYGAVKAYATRLIRHEMERNGIPGLSIVLVDDQRVLWAEGFGFADKEAGRPATADTLYRVGSVSKLFTATAALQLAEQGKLDLDQPLQRYVPEFAIRARSPDAPPVTLRALLTHHAGLPRDLAKGMWTRRPGPFTDVARQLADADAPYAPNQLFTYSNVGIDLVGQAIQNASGMPFADYLHRAVLTPLGMAGAGFEPGPAASAAMAKGYLKGELREELPLRDVPAGGLNASAADLGRFLAAIFAEGRAGDRQVLRPATVREMLRPQNADVPLDLGFPVGLGWMLATLGGRAIEHAGPVAHHAGGTLHFRSQLYAVPEHKLGVAVLANSPSATHAVDTVARETLTLALEAKRGIRQPARPRVPAADPPWPAERLQPWVGDYTTLAGHLRVRLESGRLRAEALGRSFHLVPRSDGRLAAEYALLGLIKVDLGPLADLGFALRRVAGREVLVVGDGRRDFLAGERLPPPVYPASWRQRVGRYEIADLGEDHRLVERLAIVEDRGLLLAETTLSQEPDLTLRFPVVPLSDHAARLPGQLADGGETLRCEPAGNGGERCRFAGYTLKRVSD